MWSPLYGIRKFYPIGKAKSWSGGRIVIATSMECHGERKAVVVNEFAMEG